MICKNSTGLMSEDLKQTKLRKKWHLWCTIKTADDNKLNNGLRKKSLKAAQSSKYEATVRSPKLAKKIELSLQSRE